MDGRKALEIDPGTAPAVAPAVPPRTGRELPVWLAATAALLGPVLVELCSAIEPAPAHPGAPEPLLATIVAYAVLASWLAAAATALVRRPAALGWAAGAAALTTVMVVACPSTGHHHLGPWWYGQMALCAGALAASVAALRSWTVRRA